MKGYKKIKIVNKGMFLTSRGMCRGPITRPYYEKFESIFRLIAKGAEVFEVLDDRSEVKLTEQNFDKDNSRVGYAVKPKESNEVKEPEKPKEVNPIPPTTPDPIIPDAITPDVENDADVTKTEPNNTNSESDLLSTNNIPLSRRERRRMNMINNGNKEVEVPTDAIEE